MKKFFAVLCAALMGALVLAPVADARDGRGYGYGRYDRGYDRGHHHGRRNNNNDAVAAGVAGLIIGAVVGSALSRPSAPPPQRYYAPPPPPPQPYYQGGSYGDGYNDGYGYQGGGYAPPPQRVCYRTERQWDPYAGRNVPVDIPYNC